MTIQTQYGPIIDGVLSKDGFQAPLAPPRDETSDVEKAGYRNLAQQIRELEDAGILLQRALRNKYPALPPLEEPTE